MPDRIDPEGGWFALDPMEAKPVDSVTSPRLVQAIAVAPKQSFVDVRRFNASQFIADTGQELLYDRGLGTGGVIENTLAAAGSSVTLYYNLGYLPVGAIITRFRFQHSTVSPSGFGAAFFSILDSAPNVPGVGFSASPSVTTGSFVIEERNFSAVPVADRTVLADSLPVGVLTLNLDAGAAAGDVKFAWLEVTATLPG